MSQFSTIICQDEKAKKVVGRGKEKQTDTERSNFVLSWASSAIASAAAATERSALNRDASNSGNGIESAKKKSSSASNAVTLSKEGIYSTSQHPLTLRLMQLLCGAASLLYTTIDSSARSSAQEVLAAADSDQQVTFSPLHCPAFSCPFPQLSLFLISSFLPFDRLAVIVQLL